MGRYHGFIREVVACVMRVAAGRANAVFRRGSSRAYPECCPNLNGTGKNYHTPTEMLPTSFEVKTVERHHFLPRIREVVCEFLRSIVRRVGFRDSSKTGVRTEK